MKSVIPGLCAGLVAGGLLVGHANAGGAEVDKAKTLYKQATAEMNAGKFDDAARDYGAVYEITKDPVMFFKIAGAQQKAGNCKVAVAYYTRYLKEAHPSQDFVDTTNKRIEECGGAAAAGGAGAGTGTGTGAGTATAAGTGTGTGAAIQAKPGGSNGLARPDDEAGAGTHSAVDTGAVGAKVEVHQQAPAHHTSAKNGAWILVGTALGTVTLGAIFAYSASSTDQNVKDLYVTPNGGSPPVFSDPTRKAYDDLTTDADRYRTASYISFGVAGACAIGATVLFLRDRHHDESHVSIAPIVTPHETGVAASLRF